MGFWPFVGAVALGLSGELYYPIPGLGVMSFIEIFSFGAAVLILITNWAKFGRHMRFALAFAMLWVGSAVISGILSGLPFKVCLKEVAVCSSSWSIMAVSWYVLRKNARLYLVYLVGAGIGGYIGLYYFRQGVFLAYELKAMEGGHGLMDILIEKQIYPIYANAIFYGGILPFVLALKRFPVFLIMGGCLFAGFYLLVNGGSRSMFGFYVLSALTAFGVSYAKGIVKICLRNRFMMCLVGLFFVGMVFMVYATLAKSGGLGESELSKYEDQFQDVETKESGLIGRGSYVDAIEIFCSTPWGIGPQFGTHSVLTSAMIKEGLIGLSFWVYYMWQVLWFLSRRMPYSGKYSAFIMLMLTTGVWAALGSPFGARHIFFVSFAFIMLCRDSPSYGAGDLFQFDGKYLRRLRGASPCRY